MKIRLGFDDFVDGKGTDTPTFEGSCIIGLDGVSCDVLEATPGRCVVDCLPILVQSCSSESEGDLNLFLDVDAATDLLSQEPDMIDHGYTSSLVVIGNSW